MNNQEHVQTEIKQLYDNLNISESYLKKKAKEYPSDLSIKLHRLHLIRIINAVKNILNIIISDT